MLNINHRKSLPNSNVDFFDAKEPVETLKTGS